MKKIFNFKDFLVENIEGYKAEVDNLTARYYDDFDDEEEPATESDLNDFNQKNIRKIQLYEDKEKSED